MLQVRLRMQVFSLPLEGGGPLAVEGVLLNSNVIYHVLLYPTPSVTYGASSLQEGAFLLLND